MPSSLLLLLACAGPATDEAGPDDTADDTASDTSADDTGGDPSPTDELRLTDGSGLIATVSLSLATVEVTGGVDVQFQWDDLTATLTGQDVNPGELSLASLVQLPGLSPEDAERRIVDGTLLQEDVGFTYGASMVEDDAINLSQLGSIGNALPAVEAFAPDSGTWVFFLQSMTSPAAAAMVAVVPRADDTLGDKVDMDTYGSALDISATFGLAQPAQSPVVPEAIDWTALEHAANGRTWADWQVDTLMVSRYDTTDLDTIAEGLAQGDPWPRDSWTALAGPGARLEDVADLVGPQPFTGFAGDGTWVVSLRCSRCWLQFPQFAAVVSPTP